MPTYTIERSTVNIPYWPNFNHQAITRDSNGVFWCAYTRAGPPFPQLQTVIARSVDGMTWVTDDVIVGVNDYDAPSIAVDTNGILHLIHTHSGQGLVYTSRPSAGGAWNPEQLIYGTIVSVCASMTIDSLNNVHVVYERSLAGDRCIAYQQRSLGVWQPVEWVGVVAGVNQDSPSIAIDLNDNVHVSWDGNGWGAFPARDQAVYRSRIGGVWQAVETLNEADANQVQVRIAIDRLGLIHVFWGNHPGGVGNWWKQYRRRQAAGWDPMIEFELVGGGSGANHGVSVTHGNQVYTSYEENAGGSEQGCHREVINGAAFGPPIQDTAFTLPVANRLQTILGIFNTYPQQDGYSLTNPVLGIAYLIAYWHGPAFDYEVMIVITPDTSWYNPAPPPVTAPQALTLPATEVR